MKKEYIAPVTEETNTVTFNLIASSTDIGTLPANPFASKKRTRIFLSEEEEDFYNVDSKSGHRFYQSLDDE